MAELSKWTVIVHYTDNANVDQEWVTAEDEDDAFRVAAPNVADYPSGSAVFIGAIPGWVTVTGPAGEGQVTAYVSDMMEEV